MNGVDAIDFQPRWGQCERTKGRHQEQLEDPVVGGRDMAATGRNKHAKAFWRAVYWGAASNRRHGRHATHGMLCIIWQRRGEAVRSAV